MSRTTSGSAEAGRTLVMGVVNVTPDSFSDGGQWYEPQAAITHGRELISQGADLVDVGGESTRPGAERPSEAEELRRVLPVVAGLVGRGVPVSIDTMRPRVARAAVAEGAALINDVSGGMADPQMLPTVAELGVDYVLMHWRGHSVDMQTRARYDRVGAEVAAELRSQVDRAIAAGIAPQRLILDPGIGFAKTAEHNWDLLADLSAVAALGHRLLIGVSRKTFLGRLLATEAGPRPARERDDASLALTAYLALQGVWAVRTHTVGPHRDAVQTIARLRSSPTVHPPTG